MQEVLHGTQLHVKEKHEIHASVSLHGIRIFKGLSVDQSTAVRGDHITC